jgi:hypothetical protein
LEFHVCPCSAYGVPASPFCHKGFRFEADMKGDRPKDLGRGSPINWKFDAQPVTPSMAVSFRTTGGSSGGGRLATSKSVNRPCTWDHPGSKDAPPEGFSRAVEYGPIRSRFTVHSVFSGIHRLSHGRQEER